MKIITEKSKPIYALLMRIFGLAVGVTAITLQLYTNAIVGKGFMSNHVLAYFTLQTNIFSSLIFLYLVSKTIFMWIKNRKLEVQHMYRSLHLACTFYITITMTVYWLALAPMLGVGDNPLMIANTLFLHLFTPLCAIVDCVFFFEHGSLKKIDSVKWLAYPIAYLVSIIIIANVSNVPYYKFKMNGTEISLRYPYPFIDPQVVGIGGMIGVSIGLVVICLLFGLLYIYIDQKIGEALSKHSLKKEEI